MKRIIDRGATSVILHVFAEDLSTSLGYTNLAYNTASLACAKIRDGETVVDVTLEDITTLGTYQAPTSNGHMRLKKISDSSPKTGLIEIHIHNDWVDATNNRNSLVILLGGATNLRPLPIELYLRDPKESLANVRSELSAVPSGSSVSPSDMITFGFMYLRNRRKVSTADGDEKLYKDGGTQLGVATITKTATEHDKAKMT